MSSIKQKLMNARDAMRCDRTDVIGNQTSKATSRFYRDASEEENADLELVDSTERREQSPVMEHLNELMLRRGKLAQALLNVEGIDDDDTCSVSSSGSGCEISLLTYNEAAHFSAVPPADNVERMVPLKTVNEAGSPTSMNTIGSDFVDLGPEASSIVDLEEYYAEAISDVASPWYQRLAVVIMAWYVDLIDAFSETNDDIAVKAEPKRALNVKELRHNLRRCRHQARPYLETLAGFWDIFTWKNALTTLMLFWVFMYCVWSGYVITVFLFLLLLQLAINYLSYCRKVKLNLTLLPRKEIDQEIIESPGAQLIIEVARQAQIVLEFAADCLEKIKNLFKWKKPKMTALFMLVVFFWFVVSMCTKTSTFLTILGFGLGVKLFLTTYLFYRFPRLRHKLDVFTWFLDRTPADQAIQRHLSDQSPDSVHGSSSRQKTLSSSEAPRLTRTCALIDKEKSFPFNVGSGKLFITSSHIIFKYSRWNSGQRQIVKIPFDDIFAVKKSRLTNMGDGMALEVFVSGRDKPYFFSGIVRRDECYETLLTLGKIAGVTWSR